MKQDDFAILHHKYSLEDGHITKQIINIDGYRGIMMTTKPKQQRAHSPFTSVISLEELKKNPDFIKNHNVVGVHIHHGTLASKFLFLKEKYDIPFFVGFRGKDATAYPKKKQNLKKLKKLFRVSDMFFPVCEHLKKEIIKLGCPKDKIRVLYGGVDLNRFEYKPRILGHQETIRFLAIGRFVEKKGFTYLIRAFAKAKKELQRVKLILIGQGPYEEKYRKLITKLDLGRSVEIVPWVHYQEIQKQFHSAHIFCAPSCTDGEGNQEGIPNTLKEAMATGMPVISTTHAGIPELIENKASGLLVPERSVSDLAKAMIWLANHPNRWESMGQNARNKIETDFNVKRQLEKQKNYYDEVILKRNVGR